MCVQSLQLCGTHNFRRFRVTISRYFVFVLVFFFFLVLSFISSIQYNNNKFVLTQRAMILLSMPVVWGQSVAHSAAYSTIYAICKTNEKTKNGENTKNWSLNNNKVEKEKRTQRHSTHSTKDIPSVATN